MGKIRLPDAFKSDFGEGGVFSQPTPFATVGDELAKVGSSGGPQPGKRSLAKQMDLSVLDKPTETFDVNGVPMKAEGFEGFTPGQTVGLGALSTGLEAAGAIMDIRENERMEMQNIADQFDFQMENIEYQEWMGREVSQIRRGRELSQRIQNIRRQRVGGGQQRQQFFRDPVTGAQL